MRVHKAPCDGKRGGITSALLVNNGDPCNEGGSRHDRCLCSSGLYHSSFEGRSNSFLYYKEWCADGVAFS